MTRTKHLFIGFAMLAAASLAVAITPREKIADHGPKVDLETMIPKQFGEWVMDEKVAQPVVNPQLEKVINETYRQTLSRTYVDQQGQRIMLSLAYGGSHGEGMQTHRPEVCYPAQGFNVDKTLPPQSIQTSYGDIPVRRLVASHGPRVEPITYWVVVGDTATEFGTQMKFAQLRYNITGVIPDGMLVRVSSIDRDENSAFNKQEKFILELLNSLTEPYRIRVMGKLGA